MGVYTASYSSHPEASDPREYMQEILCTERGLGCNNAVMSSVDGHYEQIFSEIASATREDGQTVVSADT